MQLFALALLASLNPLPIDSFVGIREALLFASDGGGGLGASVSISGNTLVAGAPSHDAGGGPSSGAVYVFVKNGSTWVEQAKLLASDGDVSDSFGHSVSIEADTVVVGAPGANAAYVFERSGTQWKETIKLLGSDSVYGDSFGWSVALSKGTVLVGAYNHNGKGPQSHTGAAYVFKRSNQVWAEEGKLLGSASPFLDWFGSSVALEDDTALIGAPGVSAAGSAYVFVRSGTQWVEHDRLLASDGALGDTLGRSVSLSGGTALLGAPGDNDNGFSSGSAYVFVRAGNAWVEEAKLLASDGAAVDRFASSLSVSGDGVLIGAPGVKTNWAGAGAAYVFTRSGVSWNEQTKLLDPFGAFADNMGSSVQLSGSTALIGLSGDDQGGFDSGSALVFDIQAPDPLVYCVSKPGLACGTPEIGWSGESSASSADGFTITAQPARSNRAGVLLYTAGGRANLPFPAGGHILCIAPLSLGRAGPTNSGGTPGPFCDGVFTLDMNAFAQGAWAPPGGLAALNPASFLTSIGQVVNCQFWGRDSVASGSFMTDGLEYCVGL